MVRLWRRTRRNIHSGRSAPEPVVVTWASALTDFHTDVIARRREDRTTTNGKSRES